MTQSGVAVMMIIDVNMEILDSVTKYFSRFLFAFSSSTRLMLLSKVSASQQKNPQASSTIQNGFFQEFGERHLMEFKTL